jgi:phosphonate transport system permease protein
MTALRPGMRPTTARPLAPLTIPPRPSRRGRRIAGIAITVLVIVCFWAVDVNWGRLGELPGEIVRYVWLMFSAPDWTKLPEALLQTWRSIAMAWSGTVIGAILALPLGFLASRGYAPAPVRWVLRVLFGAIRSVPEVIVAIVILSVTGLTPLTGALALAVSSVANLSKWGYESIERADPGPIEAVRAAGGSTAQVIRWGVWPTVAPDFISFWLYRFEISVRSSAVLGLIGVGGIGDMLTSYAQYRLWPVVGVLLLVVVVATMSIDAVSGAIRRRITEGAGARELGR